MLGAQPLDGDGAGAGADVPQHLARQRHQPRQGRGAHFALGDLAVVLERVLGQPRHAGKDLRVGPGDAFDGDGVEIGATFARPFVGAAREALLLHPAHMLEHGDRAGAEAARRQQPRQRHRRPAVPAQHQQPASGNEVNVHRLQGAAVDGQAFYVRDRPAHARGGEDARRSPRCRPPGRPASRCASRCRPAPSRDAGCRRPALPPFRPVPGSPAPGPRARPRRCRRR